MSSPSIKLYRLRGIFIAYFVLKSIAGTVVAWITLRPAYGVHFGRRVFSPGWLAAYSLMIAAVILLVAWLVFAQLLQRRNWARVLLLVFGWLAVIGAVFSLLVSTHAGELGSWLSRLAPETAGMDWDRLLLYDRIQKAFELLFWGYLISVLQFDHAVRDEFFPGPGADGTPPQR
jgi:hypothetical protein